MTRQEILTILRIERECVSRDCNRDCANCDLVQEQGTILSMYDSLIELLEKGN